MACLERPEDYLSIRGREESVRGGLKNRPGFFGGTMKLNIHSWDKRDFLGIILRCTKAERGAEIGVYAGELSELLLRGIPDLKLHLIDPYRHFPKEVYDDLANSDQDVQDARYEYVCKLFAKNENVEILRLTSEEAAPKIPDESLDFVYIDANHAYEFVKRDIELWWPKVKQHGILAGHDYTQPQVAAAVINSNLSEEIHWLTAGDIWMVSKGKDVFK